MKLKALFKKVENANELAKMTGSRVAFCVYIEVDELALTRTFEGGYKVSWFDKYEQVVKSVAEDWNKQVCDQLLNGNLTKTKDGYYTIDSGIAKIDIQVCY